MTSEPRNPNDLPPPVVDEGGDDAIIGRAFRWSALVLLLIGAAAGGVIYYFKRPQPVQPLPPPERVAAETRQETELRPRPVVFTDVTAAAGLAGFRHQNGAYGDKLLPETMGGGCAALDFDADGDQDILLVNSTDWPGHASAEPARGMGLFANDGRGVFTDVSAGSGLAEPFYAQGVAVGDYDADGLTDVFLSAVGPDRLFRNLGGGKFADVTAAAGVAGADDAWGTSCAFCDFDNDADLDLFVCNYLRWSPEIDLALNCTLDGQTRAYCRPDAFDGAFCYLYRNDGAKFADVSAAAGLHVTNPATDVPLCKALGVAPIDIDRDGWLDFVVANDTVQNCLFRARGDGTFEEVGVLAGLAFDPQGNARGAMGIDTARFRNDETLGIGIGNFADEQTALFVSQDGLLQFSDEANATGVGPPSRLDLKFGLFFFDYDNDGRLDLFTANGHLENDIQKIREAQTYEQAPHLFWNCGPDSPTEFVRATEAETGPDVQRPLVGRGAAYADFDADGDLDVLIAACGGPPRLLRNDQQLGHHWLRVQLVGQRCHPQAIGAWVEIQLGDQLLSRQVMPTRSYLSQVELPVTFGLGETDQIEALVVHWPDGTQQTLSQPAVDQTLVIEQETPTEVTRR